MLQAKGRELRYGQIIELQHELSSKRAQITHHPAVMHKEGRKAEVSEAGEACWFRIMPRLRVHTEGEKVHVGDPVLLQHVVTGQKLFVAAQSNPLADGRLEVTGALEGSALKVMQYRDYGDEAALALYGGQTVWRLASPHHAPPRALTALIVPAPAAHVPRLRNLPPSAPFVVS